MTERTTVYEAVTQRIITDLEAGTAPWVQPWAVSLPRNAVSQRSYSGVNVLLLWQAAAEHEYRNHTWLTFRQAKQLGGSVRRGEKSISIVYASTYQKRGIDEATQEETSESIPFLKRYRVFNAAQTEGLPEHLYCVSDPQPFEDREATVEAFLARLGADVHHGYPRAGYNQEGDIIVLPHPQDFVSAFEYYSTSLHEHSHWTGHQSRLNRDLRGRFGSSAYAMEELIAELASAFVSAELGIQTQLQHASYIESWLEVLTHDSKAIFTAARRATEAAQYLHEQAEKRLHATSETLIK